MLTNSLIFNGLNNQAQRLRQPLVPITLKIYRSIDNYDRVVIIHVFHALDLGCFLDCEQLRKIVVFPMFLSSSYSKAGEEVPTWYLKKEREILKRISKIITPSPYEAFQLSSEYGINNNCITCIPRKINNYFRPKIRNGVSTPLKLICVGAHRKQKRTHLIPHLMLNLQNRGVAASLTMVGSIQDTAEFDLYKNNCIKFNVADQVREIGSVSPADLAKLYDSSDLLVSFSSCETFGRAIREGLSTGLPSIILDEQGEIIKLFGVDNGIKFCQTIEEMGEIAMQLTYKSNEYSLLSKHAINGSLYLNSAKLDVELSYALLS